MIANLTTFHDERYRSVEKELVERKTIVDYLGEKLRHAQSEIDKLKRDAVSVKVRTFSISACDRLM